MQSQCILLNFLRYVHFRLYTQIMLLRNGPYSLNASAFLIPYLTTNSNLNIFDQNKFLSYLNAKF